MDPKLLKAAAARARSASNPRHALPVYSFIDMEAGEDGLSMAVEDGLAVGVRDVIPCDVRARGRAAISAETFNSVADNVGDGLVGIESLENGAIAVRSGRSHTKLPGVSVTFPERLPPPSTQKFDGEGLCILIKRVLDSARLADARQFFMAGALLSSEGGRVTMVSTEGHRLSWASIPGSLDLAGNVVIPPAGLIAILAAFKKCAEVEIGIVVRKEAHGADSGRSIVVSGGGTTVTSLLQGGVYPSWKGFIPSEEMAGQRVVVSSDDLRAAVARAVVVYSGTGVELSLQADKLEVLAETEKGDVTDWIPVEFDGSPVRAGVSPRYLDQFLSMAPDRVEIRIGKNANETAHHMGQQDKTGPLPDFCLDPLVLTPVGEPSYPGLEFSQALWTMRLDAQ